MNDLNWAQSVWERTELKSGTTELEQWWVRKRLWKCIVETERRGLCRGKQGIPTSSYQAIGKRLLQKCNYFVGHYYNCGLNNINIGMWVWLVKGRSQFVMLFGMMLKMWECLSFRWPTPYGGCTLIDPTTTIPPFNAPLNYSPFASKVLYLISFLFDIFLRNFLWKVLCRTLPKPRNWRRPTSDFRLFLFTDGLTVLCWIETHSSLNRV